VKLSRNSVVSDDCATLVEQITDHFVDTASSKVTCSIVMAEINFRTLHQILFLDLQFGSSSNLTDDYEINESGVTQNHPYPGSTCGQDLELEFDYY